MDWETIAWIALVASSIVIVMGLFSKPPEAQFGKQIAEAETTPMQALQELAYPLAFVAFLGLLGLKSLMSFSAVLLTATVISGGIWLIDIIFFKQRRLAKNAAAGIGAAPTSGRSAPIVVETAASFFPVILVVFLLRSFLYEPFKIPTPSMVPSLLVGDHILVNKYAYGVRLPVLNKKIMDVGLPARGDVMVFRYPLDTTKDYIKRVVGIPGDVVNYKDKRLTINGIALATTIGERYVDNFQSIEGRSYQSYQEKLGEVSHRMMVLPDMPSLDRRNVRPFPNINNCAYNGEEMTCKVPDGHYFMMGDNRDGSDDSRYWGFVPEENIVGRAFLVWMNYDAFSRIGTKIQ